MLILFVENVGNFQNDARDSIVVLTLIAWAAIVTSAQMVFPTTFKLRRGIAGSRFFFSYLFFRACGGTKNLTVNG